MLLLYSFRTHFYLLFIGLYSGLINQTVINWCDFTINVFLNNVHIVGVSKLTGAAVWYVLYIVCKLNSSNSDTFAIVMCF